MNNRLPIYPFGQNRPTMPRMAELIHGVMFDLGRGLERRPYYRRAIDFLADRGVNAVLWHFTDDQGCGIDLASVPGVGSPHAYSPAEMRDLVGYARDRGVRLVPEVASLGHTVYLTRLPRFRHLAESTEMFSSFCPVAAEVRPLLRAILEETATIFDGPDFHVGLDETNFGHHPLSAAALRTRTRTEIFADHITFVHGVVAGLGRRTWMWADGLLHDPDLAARLPRDIVMCNWKYRPEEPTKSTQYLLDQGFDVVLCSASISSEQQLFPGERFALRNVRSLQRHAAVRATTAGGGRVLGQVNTVWTPVRFLADSLWLGLDLALALMRDGAGIDLDARIVDFGRAFYGLADTTAWVAACRVVVRCSPRRGEWLAVLNLRPPAELDGPTVDSIAAAAPEWARARSLLADVVAAGVRQHEVEFGAFSLMVELAAHAYGVAAAVADLGPAGARRAAAETARLLAAVDANWDRERYADDPRKYAAPIHHFDGDHLIPMIRVGLARLEAMAAGPG